MNEREKIQENLKAIGQALPQGVRLCAVTKYHTVEETQDVIDCGVTILGENKVQDLLKKMEVITAPVDWHFIGHLQTNKVKYLIGRVALIESVDSLKVLKKIQTESAKHDVVTPVLIQYNLTGEDQKYGFDEDQTRDWLSAMADCPNVRVRGIMGMGPHTEDDAQIRKVFHRLHTIYDKISSSTDQDNVAMQILSMGMSHDYPIAVEEGANLVRIGSKIFS